ncbi:cell morphogenesis N-terminal-domain-containing protein [Myxozyma melibiosi]|uniref:Cell morphogenesis N-terminal-domain-containing protein n=1 Tax=Myxozyma melibiosi TaxID=54550 RepID=A0ABR1F1L1_9ASCO
MADARLLEPASIVVPDFADFPSYSAGPALHHQQQQHQPSSTPATSSPGLQPPAVITESPPRPASAALPASLHSPTRPASAHYSQEHSTSPHSSSPLRRHASLSRPQIPRSVSLASSSLRRSHTTASASPALPQTPPRQLHHLQQPHQPPASNEPITPAEYSLHIIFTQFVRQAEKKLNLCLSYSSEEEPPITTLLAAGADPVFDKILESLGYISRQKPRPVIDAVMFWRKSKSEAATAAARERNGPQNSFPFNHNNTSSQSSQPQPQQPQQQQKSTLVVSGQQQIRSLRHKVSKSLSDRSPIGNRHGKFSPNNGPQSPSSNASAANGNHQHNSSSLGYFGIHRHQSSSAATQSNTQQGSRPDSAQQADRKSLISIYILCRVLIEVVKQTSSSVLGEEMGDKLEEIVFRQIKASDPNLVAASPIRLANWRLFAELLGEMSRMRFTSVSDRFIAELEKTAGDQGLSKEQEQNIQVVIHGMEYLQLKVYPLELFEDSADFIHSLCKFFVKSHGQRVKHAYCEILNTLLLSIAGVITAEVNHPTWVKTIDLVYPKVLAMMSKQRYWADAFQLACTILCVAPTQFFADNWIPLVEANFQKLKDAKSRVAVIIGISRLIWVYLRRCSESYSTIEKRLDGFAKVLFPAGNKKPWLTADRSLIDACVQMIRFIGWSQPDYCIKNLIYPLMSSDTLTRMGDNNLSVDSLAPEHMHVAIRAFISILLDAADNTPPPFYSPDPPLKQGSVVIGERSLQEQPVMTEPPPVLRDHYAQFSRLLGKILLICDSHFGGQVVLDEKMGKITPKTPSSFNFAQSGGNFGSALGGSSGNSNSQTSNEVLHANYELLLTVYEAIPLCIPQNVSFGRIVEILCKGTAHPDPRLAAAAANSLKSLARSGQHSQQTIVTGFARFIFNYEERYSAYSESSMLDSSSNVENTLKIYVQLLSIWINVIRQKTAAYREATAANNGNSTNGLNGATPAALVVTPISTDSSSRGEEMETTSVWSVIEEVESNGLFFLCSQSRTVRCYAIAVLRLIREFDVALEEQVEVLKMQSKNQGPSHNGFSRIIEILEATDGPEALNTDALEPSIVEAMSTAERMRLSQLQLEGKELSHHGILVRLAQSDSGVDSALWLRLFPKFLELCLSRFPMPVALCRDSVCSRLIYLHKPLMDSIEAHSKSPSSSDAHWKHNARTHPKVLIEQWKLYMIVACSTLTATDDQEAKPVEKSAASSFAKRKGPPQLTVPYKRITSAKVLFRMVIPLLQTDYALVREAVIAGLECININLYKSLIEAIQPMVSAMGDRRSQNGSGMTGGFSNGNSANHNQHGNGSNAPSSPSSGLLWRKTRKHDWMRIEITHLLQLTSHFIKEPIIYNDPWILEQHISFVRDTKNFLCQPEIASDWGYQKLRRYFCGFMQTLYEGIKLTEDSNRWLPFEARVSLFKMIEEWCGYGQYADIAHDRNEKMRRAAIEQSRDTAEQGVLMASFEVEKGQLELATLSAMASLLDGPLTETIESHGAQAAVMSFDVPAIFQWANAVFDANTDRMHTIGRRAIVNMLRSNKGHADLLARTITYCYHSESGPRASESYFYVLADVLINDNEYPCDMRQPIALGLFKIGDERSQVRVKAAALLKAVELRFFGKSKVQDYEISISDRTTAVYKRAQFNLSNQFSLEYDDLKYTIFSELSMYFHIVSPHMRRDILAIMIPWISNMELQLEPNGKNPSPSAYMVMTNLFEITIRFSNEIQNEVEALWVTLASNRHMGNVRAILDYLINMGVERRDPAFVEYSKQIVVYIASTPAGSKLVEALVAYIQPTSMLHTSGEAKEYNGIHELFPYTADLTLVLPPAVEPVGFSIGQLAMILLVDLFVSPVTAMSANLALLMQVVFVLFDHYNQLVHEQARELLVHLIHEISLSNETEIGGTKYKTAAEIIDLIRKRDLQTTWSYDDLYMDEAAMRKPKHMDGMIQKVLLIFEEKYPKLKDEWSRIALTWATTCPVRHFACRSFQIFRSTFVSIDQSMLADMLVRLSNTIADPNPDIQNFAMQILMTLNRIVESCDSVELMDHPQVFWATVASMQTVNQSEFIEGVTILNNLLDKVSLNDPEVVSKFISAFPQKWEGGKFDGLQQTLLPGVRSRKSYDVTMTVLDRLNLLESNELVGDESRLFYATLCNLPRFAHALEIGIIPPAFIVSAEKLAQMAELESMPSLARILNSFAKGRFRAKTDFVKQIVHSFQSTVFQKNESNIMVFFLGILSNDIPYVRLEAMEFLKYLFPLIDMRREEFVAIGADLISPLLRLLQTEYAEQALQVLDEATYIPGTHMDRRVLRASLGGRSMMNRREDIESTATTFGIPDETGWAVAMPAVRASVARSNVHAVFYSCEVANMEYHSLNPDTVVEFSRDEFRSYSGGFYRPVDTFSLTGRPSVHPVQGVDLQQQQMQQLQFQRSNSQFRYNHSQLASGMADGGYFGGAFGMALTRSSSSATASAILARSGAAAANNFRTPRSSAAKMSPTAYFGGSPDSFGGGSGGLGVGVGAGAGVGPGGMMMTGQMQSSSGALERSDTMTSYAVGDDTDGSVNHLVAALDNLTSFFAEEPTAYTTALE